MGAPLLVRFSGHFFALDVGCAPRSWLDVVGTRFFSCALGPRLLVLLHVNVHSNSLVCGAQASAVSGGGDETEARAPARERDEEEEAAGERCECVCVCVWQFLPEDSCIWCTNRVFLSIPSPPGLASRTFSHVFMQRVLCSHELSLDYSGRMCLSFRDTFPLLNALFSICGCGTFLELSRGFCA